MVKIKQPKNYTSLDEGLTSQQVDSQVKKGLTNVQIKKLSRPLPKILADNLFTLFNLLNLVIAILIFWTGSYRNLFFLGPVVANIIIGSYQEIRAKLTVDKISLVNAATFSVTRDGQKKQLDIADLVEDDIVTIKRGDTIPADGIVRFSNGLQTNESSITGESNTINKQIGAEVFSGSFAIAGQAQVQLTQVGTESFVSKISSAVGKEKRSVSVLMKIVNNIIKILTYTIIPIGLLLFYRSFSKSGDVAKAILGTSASVIGMIPEGLVLLTSVALATGAYNLTKRRILVCSLSAIETLARVDVLCLDKTGTITTGKLTVKKTLSYGSSESNVQAIAQKIVEATQETKATALAVKAIKVTALKTDVKDVIPFSSETKYSGFVNNEGSRYIMGAPEFIIKNPTPEVTKTVEDAAKHGFRVIAILKDDTLLGLLMISDEVRKQAPDTFNYLKNQGMDLKIISGDNPLTVAEIAKRVGVDDTE